jgi:hypothetical protein
MPHAQNAAFGSVFAVYADAATRGAGRYENSRFFSGFFHAHTSFDTVERFYMALIFPQGAALYGQSSWLILRALLSWHTSCVH